MDEPTTLVTTNTLFDPEGTALFKVQHTVILSKTNDGQTALDITSEVLSAGPNAHQFLSGMEPSLSQAFDQLSIMLAAR